MKFIIIFSTLLVGINSFACKSIEGDWSCRDISRGSVVLNGGTYLLNYKSISNGLQLTTTDKDGVIVTVMNGQEQVEMIDNRRETTVAKVVCRSDGADILVTETGIVPSDKSRSVTHGNTTNLSLDYRTRTDIKILSDGKNIVVTALDQDEQKQNGVYGPKDKTLYVTNCSKK